LERVYRYIGYSMSPAKTIRFSSVVGLKAIMHHIKVVLTNYNHKCYRVDSVDFEQTPKSTFLHRASGE
jgi:hypothetical protein